MENKRKLLVLYATETGNAQDVAERIAREAERRYYAPVLQSTASYEPVRPSESFSSAVIFQLIESLHG